jgi:hypothetical protein
MFKPPRLSTEFPSIVAVVISAFPYFFRKNNVWAISKSAYCG